MASQTPNSATHGPVKKLKDGTEVQAYYPASTYETFGAGIDHPSTTDSKVTLEKSALAFVLKKNSFLDDNSIKIQKSWSSDVAHHAYVDQVHDGIPFSNVRANVSFDRYNKVIAFGSSLVPLNPDKIAESKPEVLLNEAIETAERQLEGKSDDKYPKLRYLVREDGSAVLTYVIRITNKAARIEAFVDAHTKDSLVSATDLVLHASYRVLPIQKQQPNDVLPDRGFENLLNPLDPIASPFGWHDVDPGLRNTSGNNAIVTDANNQTTAPQAPLQNFVFHYPHDPGAAPALQANVHAARVNAFYVVNTMHDISYRYGFTEAAGNFQETALPRNGRLEVIVQFAGNTGNGEYEPPIYVDGPTGVPQLSQRAFIKLEISAAQRDTSFANDLIIHEFTHGITTMMTNTLPFVNEARGLSEGLSDVMAWWITRTGDIVNPQNVLDYVFGRYLVPDNINGLRASPYSTNVLVNNLRYSSAAIAPNDRYRVGLVWGTILYQVYADLVAARGFSANARTNPNGTGGNVIFMRLYMDSLPLLIGQPTFVAARDAWIQADATRYGGDHRQILWGAFAGRGLGQGAANYVDSDVVPV